MYKVTKCILYTYPRPWYKMQRIRAAREGYRFEARPWQALNIDARCTQPRRFGHGLDGLMLIKSRHRLIR